MPKRFTETEKWKDKWFRALKPEYKLAWIYLLDNCDIAGVVDIDEELANFQIGEDVDWDAFYQTCENRIDRTQRGKVIIVRFIEFQYGKLSPACKPHMPVIAKLRSHGIEIESIPQNESFKHGNVTDKRREEVFIRDGHQCCYCGGVFSPKELQPDHVTPKTKGGNDSKDNLVAACVSCNAKKLDRDVSEFIGSLKDPDSAWQRLYERLPERLFNSLEDKEQEQEQEKDKDQEQDQEQETPIEPRAKHSPRFKQVWTLWKKHLRETHKPLAPAAEEVQLMNLGRCFATEEERIGAILFSIERQARNLILNGDHKRQNESRLPGGVAGPGVRGTQRAPTDLTGVFD
jgi:5-methylcytosine-specific restriction endonuclease McrA